MNIYMLSPKEGAKGWSYDCAWGFIVAAASEPEARAEVLGQCGDECRHYMQNNEDEKAASCVWRDPSKTDCDLIGTASDDMPGVYMRDFHAG